MIDYGRSDYGSAGYGSDPPQLLSLFSFSPLKITHYGNSRFANNGLRLGCMTKGISRVFSFNFFLKYSFSESADSSVEYGLHPVPEGVPGAGSDRLPDLDVVS